MSLLDSGSMGGKLLETELSLARELNKLLKAKGLTVAVAEGSTGG
jgi:nicotinamide mononucleotide (NMN) deamidase PncC